MNPLPAAIEHSLAEAGCSATEIILIQHMLNGEPTTLRALAQKTGKSTGVLDQAMKKLMQKGIIVRKQVNDAPKFVLKSLQTIVQWLHDETLRRREMLLRKYQTFEAFVTTMEHEQSRPEIHYYDGVDGIEQAYFGLLAHGKVWRHYMPVADREQDDPLWTMRVRLFRSRKEANIFSHVIAHDTQAGLTFQARDEAEFRETILLPPELCPIPFEKIIAGDVVACIQPEKHRACFVRFPEQVKCEEASFDLYWKLGKELQHGDGLAALRALKKEEKISFPTYLRQTLCTRRSLIHIALSTVALIIIGCGAWYVQRTEHIESVRSDLLQVVTDGAKLFDANTLNSIRTIQDVNTPEFKRTVSLLQKIRIESKVHIDYVYLLRPLKNIGDYEFIADGDAINVNQPIDFNGDGVIDQADAYALPGAEYTAPDGDGLAHEVPTHPEVNAAPVSDQWGQFLSAYAPIFNERNEVEAILGVDIFTQPTPKKNLL